jgi:PTH1 family peptidyl-tRNA hydrolase
MKLIVGLGNPGVKYEGTRHNVGFEVLANLARRYDVGRPKSKFKAEIAETRIGNQKTVLLSPLTYMNLSGQSVRAAVDFYKCEAEDLLVICDDLNLDVARLRIRTSGSAGGQNGLKDIIQRLGHQDFCRLRLGVGKVPPGWDAADFVLGKFSPDDAADMAAGVARAADAVETWIKDGPMEAMNRFNGNPAKAKTNEKKIKAGKRSNGDPPPPVAEQ